MAGRGGDRDRGTRRAQRDPGRRVRKKPCLFCKEHIDWIDYKDVVQLRRFMSERGKIRSRRVTGNCAQHQRGVAVAIKTARELALLPYVQRVVSEKIGQRTPRDSAREPSLRFRRDGYEQVGAVSPGSSSAELAVLADLADDVLEEVRVGELTSDDLGPLTPPPPPPAAGQIGEPS